MSAPFCRHFHRNRTKNISVLFRTGTDHSSDDSTVKADRYGGTVLEVGYRNRTWNRRALLFGRNPGEAGRRKGRDDPGDGRKRADRSGGDSDWRINGSSGFPDLEKRKTAGKTAAFDPALAGILLVVVVSPVPDQKDPEIGTGAGQEETETEGGEATEQQYERLLEKKGGRYPGMRGGSRESKGDDHLEIFGREKWWKKDSQREEK